MPATTMQEPQVKAMQSTPLKAQKPTEQEVEIAEVFALQAAPDLPAQLPTTASNLPLIGIFGLLSLALAFGLRQVRANTR